MKFESDHALRKALHDATRKVTDSSKHPDLIRGVATTHPHSVRLLPSDDPLTPSIADSEFTCFAFAFRLADAPGYRKIRGHFKNTFTANSEFVESLIAEHHIQEIERSEAKDYDVVVYFGAEGEPTHAGLLRGNDVISKWGVGKLLIHPLNEVPLSYGDECRFYSAVSIHAIDSLFVEHCGIDLWRIPAQPNSR